MRNLNCITFRAAADKSPGDVSRNWDRIEAIIPPDLTDGVIMDPLDTSCYVIGLKDWVDAESMIKLAAMLRPIRDERDDWPLLAEIECRAVNGCHFESHFSDQPRLDIKAL